MKKIIVLLVAAGASVSFNVPTKKATSQESEIKKENLNMLLIRYNIAQ